MTNSSTTYMVFAKRLDFLVKQGNRQEAPQKFFTWTLKKEPPWRPDQKAPIEMAFGSSENWPKWLGEKSISKEERLLPHTSAVEQPISDSNEKSRQPHEFRPELLVIVEKNSGRWLATYPCWEANEEAVEEVIFSSLLEGGAPDEIIISGNVDKVFTDWAKKKGTRVEYRSLLPDEILIIEQGLGQLNEYLQSTLPIPEGVYEEELDQKLSDFINHYNHTTAHYSLPSETVLSFWKKYCYTRQVGGLELADFVLRAAMKKSSPVE